MDGILALEIIYNLFCLEIISACSFIGLLGDERKGATCFCNSN